MTDLEKLKDIKASLEQQCMLAIQSTSVIEDRLDIENTYRSQIQTFENAILALEKQMPKKPTNYSIDNNGYMIYDCECPTCKCSHREYYPFSYCNHCGQALDWSD